MPAPLYFRTTLASPEATSDLARHLAEHLQAGDVLLLQGDLGAGKTHLARALIQKRLSDYGLVEDVPSPSYTLVQVYEVGGLEIWHCDLYRLSDPQELWELGLEEAFGNALCLVEWPDRLGLDQPADALHLELRMHSDNADTRELCLHSASATWQTRLAPVLQELS